MPAPRGTPSLTLLSLIILVWLVLLFLNPYSQASFEKGKVLIFLVGTGCLALLLLATGRQALERTGRSLRQHPLTLPLLLFAGSQLSAAALSPTPRLALLSPLSWHGALLSAAGTGFCLLAILILQDSSAQRLLVTALLVVSVPITLYGWLQFLGLDPITWRLDSVSVVQATLGRSIYLGAYLAICLPLTLNRAGAGSPASGWLYGGLALVQLGLLYLSLARSGWLAFVAATALLLWLNSRPSNGRRWLLLVAGLSVAALLFALIWTNYGGVSDLQLAKLLDARLKGDLGRIYAWEAVLARWPARPLWGHGPETFASYYATYTTAKWEIAYYQRLTDPHNLFFAVLDGSGLVGLLALGWLLGRTGRIFWQRYQQAAAGRVRHELVASAAALLAFLVSAQFNPQRVALTMLFWLLLALVTSPPESDSPADRPASPSQPV